MKGSVSGEKDAEGVMDVAKKLQKLGIAFTLITHHGRATREIKGLTDWGDLADAVRNYTGRMEIANDTKIEFYKVRYGESRWSMEVTYELRQLKNGQKAVVLVDGKRVGDTSALFKNGANPAATTPATETGRKRKASTDPSRNKDGVMDAAIERNLVRILKPEPGSVNGPRYATPTLCDLLEGCEDVDLLASSIKRYLLRLKGTKGTTAYRCYDRNEMSRETAAERWYWDAGISTPLRRPGSDARGFCYYFEERSLAPVQVTYLLQPLLRLDFLVEQVAKITCSSFAVARMPFKRAIRSY